MLDHKQRVKMMRSNMSEDRITSNVTFGHDSTRADTQKLTQKWLQGSNLVSNVQ